LIERDDAIPPLEELLLEVEHLKGLYISAGQSVEKKGQGLR
jgi:uncharacterized protein (UPF0276 family)